MKHSGDLAEKKVSALSREERVGQGEREESDLPLIPNRILKLYIDDMREAS